MTNNKWNKYYYKHRKEKLEYSKKYYLKNRKKICKRHRENWKKYYQKHYQRIAKDRKKYNKSPQGIYFFLIRRAKKLNIKYDITKEHFINWYNQQEQKCYYCNRTLNKIKKSKDKMLNKAKRLTIDRLTNKKGYTIKNIVLACFRCNFTKNNYFTPKEMIKIGKIIYSKTK